MRRLAIPLLLVTLAANAYAIDTRTSAGQLRIAILDTSERLIDARANDTALLVRGAIRNALRERGFDAFTVREHYDDLVRGRTDADYYVEIVSSSSESHPVGGVAIPVGGSIGAEIDVLVSRLAAEVRLYDGKTLDEVRTFDLRRRQTTVAPAAVIVSRPLWAFVALPLVDWARARAAARGLGTDAAAQIAAELGR
jgi:hypothetical protein